MYGIKLSLKNLEETPFSLRSDLHLIRKFWHVGSGLTGIFIYKYYHVPQPVMASYLLCLAIFGFGMDFIRLRSRRFNRYVLFVFQYVMRESEKNRYNSLPFYALGVSTTLFLYSEKVAILAILFLVFADPMASLIGVSYGRNRLFGNKSVQGALACFATCYLLTLFFSLLYNTPGSNIFIFAFIGGIIGCFSELCPNIADDNLTIPILSGLGLTSLNFVFPVF